MKKYLFLIFTSLMLLTIFTSCSVMPSTDSSSSDCTHEYSDDNDTSCNLCGKEREIISPTIWHFNYDYGFSIKEKATLLIDNGILLSGFEDIVIPDDIVAGDTINFYFNGTITTDTLYPSLIHLNGEIISYAFSYARVIHVEGASATPEIIMSDYDLKHEYVILDRSGHFIDLDDFDGNELYLVVSQEVAEHDGCDPQPLKIACILAYNPRDLEDGVTPKTVAELRNEKVTINLDHPSVEIIGPDPTWRYAGYVDYNENGNEYIKYAPNYYKYFLTVSCTNDAAEALALLGGITLEGGAVSESSDNTIKIEFLDYDAYSALEEELLNSLSSLESVEKIEVGYIEPQVVNEKIEGYDFYTGFVPIDCEEKLIKSYVEFTSLFDLSNEKNSSICAITSETFEENYVIFKSNFCYCGGLADTIADVTIKDAKLVDETLYLTEYQHFSGIHELEAAVRPIIIVIPKAELESIELEKFNIVFFDVDVYLEVE